MAEGPSEQGRWPPRPPTGLDQLTSLALPDDSRGAMNTAPPEATLDGLLQHPRLPGYLSKLYREIIALRKSQHFWLSPDESSGQLKEICQEMCRLVSRLNNTHISAADKSRADAELQAAVLGLRSVARTCANLKPSMLARTNLMIMQQQSAYPPDLVQSVHIARMMDTNLRPEQIRTIVSANVTMIEKLQQAESERRELLHPLREMLQGPSSSLQMQLANTLNFHDLVDRQIRICDAECDAIVKYTANFTRTDMLSKEQMARILAFDHPLVNAPDFCAIGRLLLEQVRKPRPQHSPPPTWAQQEALDLPAAVCTERLGSHGRDDSPLPLAMMTHRPSLSSARQAQRDAMDTGGLFFTDMRHAPLSQPPGTLPPPALMTHLDAMLPDGMSHGAMTPPPDGMVPQHDGTPDFKGPALLHDFESLFQDEDLPLPSATAGFAQGRGPMF